MTTGSHGAFLARGLRKPHNKIGEKQMRKPIAVLVLLALPCWALADRITLTDEETLSTPQAKYMDWHVSKIDAATKSLQVTYRWRNATEGTIFLGGRNDWQTWTCRDIETPGENAECTDSLVPYECCTGLGTGTCDGMDDTCFTDVFGFIIRTQDAGTKMGVGLRTLIWNKMQADVLTGGNTGTFE